VAVASAGPYASLHLAPDRQPRQHPTTRFFTGRMPFLLPNQQRQSTEGTTANTSEIVTDSKNIKEIQPLFKMTENVGRNTVVTGYLPVSIFLDLNADPMAARCGPLHNIAN